MLNRGTKMEEPKITQLKKLILKHFPKSRVVAIKRIIIGYSHYMYDCELISGSKKRDIILRLGDNFKDDSCMAKELYIMALYKRHNIPVPRIYGHDITRKSFSYDYILMEKFHDKTIADVWGSASIGDRRKIAFAMGRFLRKLHSIKVEGFGNITAGGLKRHEEFSFRKFSDAPANVEWTRQVLKDAYQDLSGLMSFHALNHQQLSRITKYLHDNVYLTEKADATLIHNDFNLEHIFIRKSGNDWRITGIIDFEFAEAYAREFDFVKLHRRGLFEERYLLDDMIKGYGKNLLHPRLLDVIRYYRMVRDIGFAYHLLKAGNEEHYKKVIDTILKEADK